MRSVIGLIAAFLLMAGVADAAGQAQDQRRSVPHLEKRGGVTRLMVDGKAFLVLGGELGNSSGEADYLRPFWPALRALNLNTLVAPVYWELMEPQEGRYDFAQVDALVKDARTNQVRLVLLWFASWKNSISSYAPAYVKTNTARFPRAIDSNGRSLDILSPHSAANRDADARAFGALMGHLRDIDREAHTVVMVQVENEIGMIPEVRDRSAVASQLFAQEVPAALLDHLSRSAERLAPELAAIWSSTGRRRAGTWEQVFGRGRAAEEIFTAWHFASYVQAVTAAGKKAYDLPMFVNAALIRPGALPGQYPSAGPLPHLADVWRAGAPAIDFLSPDIYFQNFAEWCRRYARGGNPLFIPEAQRSLDAGVNAMYAVGQHDAIGFAPFGIESIAGPPAASLAESYRLLGGLWPIIQTRRGGETMVGLLPEGPEQRLPQEVVLGDYLLRVNYERQPGPNLADPAGAPLAGSGPQMLPAGGLVVATGRDEFVFAGSGVTTTFAIEGSGDSVGIVSAEEGTFRDGAWVHLRWLNGDQTHQGRHLRLEPGRLSVQRIKLYRYR